MLIGKAECLSYADSNNAVKRSLLWKYSLGKKASVLNVWTSLPNIRDCCLEHVVLKKLTGLELVGRESCSPLLRFGCPAEGLVVQCCLVVQVRQSLACFFLFVLFSVELLKVDFLRNRSVSVTARASVLSPCSPGLVTWTGAIGSIGRSKQFLWLATLTGRRMGRFFFFK